MRKLQTRDIFTAARLIKKLNLKDKIKELKSNNEEAEAKGFDLFLAILDEAVESEAENEIYEFLAGPLEISADEIKELDPIELFEDLKNVADFNRWKSFFTQFVK